MTGGTTRAAPPPAPPVSVIVPARDAQATLPATLESILAQRYDGAVEVIVAEGSRTPATRSLLRRRFPGVRVVHNRDGTIPAALNLALAAAAHGIVVRCDAHSVLPAGYLARAVDTLLRTGAANVGGRVRPVGCTFFERAVALATSTRLGAGDARYRIGGPEGPVDTVFPGAFRRSALEAAGGWDATLLRNEDYELNWRLRRAGGTVWFDPALARQYFAYGRWKRAVLARHPGSWRARQIVPPILLAALAGAATAGAAAALAATGALAPWIAPDAWPGLAGAASAVPAVYLTALLSGAAVLLLTRRRAEALLVPVVAATIHLAWAAGFLAGPPAGARDPAPSPDLRPARAAAPWSGMNAGPPTQPRPVPRPAGVRGNDWRQVALPDARTFAPSLPVSVIVPCFEAPKALALTLAGLERQRFPRHLFEVVVVDDGSQPPIEAPGATPLAVRVVRRKRQGFGLAAARNAGVRAAAHDILVFLDGDVIAEADLLAAHARWHETVSDALTLGFCAFVSAAGIGAAAVRRRRGTLAALFADRPWDPPWFERHLARTANLTADRDDLFRAVTGHNFGIGRAFFEAIGGFDESFVRYGGEDTEFRWRAQVRGGLLVPVRDAFGWHQGRWSEGRAAKERSQDLQAGKLADLIADPGFRPDGRVPYGGRLAVPRHVVSLDGRGVPAGRIEGAVRSLLDDPCADLAVRIELGEGRNEDRNEDREKDRSRLAARFATEPRVRVAPGRHALDDHPATPFHIALPAGLDIGAGLVTRLRKALGDAAAAELALPGGASVTIARARMLHRARRAGGGPGDYGAVRTLPARILRGGGRMRRRPKPRPRPAPGGGRAVLARVWAEARHVRGPRTAWRFLRWLAGALRWRLRVGGGWRAAPAPEAPRRPAPVLGVTIAARGPCARAVFAAAAEAVAGAGARAAEVVLADTPRDAAARDAPDAPVVLLGEAPWLAVPAVDPAADNPMGWVREVEPRVAALGPRRLLPPGVRAHRQVHERDHVALAHCHHVEDTAAFHGGAVRRAGTLARLAARGVPVQLADADAALEALLGPELHGLMTAGARGADAARREALSIAMRRAALRRHSVGARVRQICAAAGPGPHARAPAPPLVSVLLATRRPAFLAGAVANVARQTWPRIELVLALHGPGFEAAAIDGALAGFPHPVRLVRLGEEHTLGAVLGAATAQARGPLLAKMDDDDLYGPEHLWDLVLAHEYSGAALVGKFPATVYLASLDRTVRQRAVPAETWSPSITGGAMLLHRDELARAGGWRPAPRHVDRLLVDDVLAAGGAVYRTHGAGYLMVRHRQGHTWEAGEERFLANAEAVHRGWRPEIADIPSGIAASPPPREPAA